MSADFRLKNPADYETWYGFKHDHPELLKEAAYGMPEFHRDEIKKARLIACPGCMASAAIFALAPIIKAGLVEHNRIVVDLKVGSSGGGAKATSASHHPERSAVYVHISIMHRHIGEVEQELNALTLTSYYIIFSPRQLT